MPERWSSNPLQIPAETRPTPDWFNLLVWELVDTVANPERLEYGAPHHDVERYLGYLLCKEERLDYKTVRRWWASPTVVNQDPWNYNISFGEESAAHPIYQRIYILRREQEAPPAVAPLPKAQPYTGVWQIRVTNGGTGYVQDLPPAVTVAAPPAGAGARTATAQAIVSNSGVVAWIVITDEGSNYATAPTVTVAAPTSGDTAIAEAKIQLATAKLVKEDLQELPDDDPRRSIFVRVVRIYETLPGPIISGTRIGEQGATETFTRQDHITGTLAVSGNYLKTKDEIAPMDSVKSRRAITTVNEWPVLIDYDVDPETGVGVTVEFQVVDNLVLPDAGITGGVHIRHKHIDKWRRLRIVETYQVPIGIAYTEQRYMAFNFPELFDYLQYIYSDACGVFYPYDSTIPTGARDARSIMVEAKLEVSFTTTKQTISGPQLAPVSLRIGKGLSIHNILVDEGSFTYTGTCTGTISFHASVPSYTEYLTTFVGNYLLISGESVKWKDTGLYKNSELYVKMV